MTRVVEELSWRLPHASVVRSGGPERVATEETAGEAPVRRYVGFVEPSPPVEGPVEPEGSASCPCVW